MLQRYGISVSHEEVERVDTLRYLWQKLNAQISVLLTELLELQPRFRTSLEESVKEFTVTVSVFTADYKEVSYLLITGHVIVM